MKRNRVALAATSCLLLALLVLSQALAKKTPQPIPVMSEENTAYFETYLQPYAINSFLFANFNEDDFEEFDPLQVFMLLSPDNYESEAFLVPADVFEAVVMEHLPTTPEQIRKNAGDRYHPEQNAYYVLGGYGGAGRKGCITQSSRNSDTLTLRCNWYTLGADTGEWDTLFAKTETTIRLLENDGYQFISNKIKHILH